VLVDAVATRLRAEAVLTARLATHGAAPAVFAERMPGDADLPLVIVDPPLVDVANDTKTFAGRTVTLNVRIFSAPENTVEVDEIAELVRAALHRRPLDQGPWKGWLAAAGGPVPTPTDRNLVGRRVAVSLGCFA